MLEVDFLAAKVIGEIVSRTGIDKHEVEEVILGQAKQMRIPLILPDWLFCVQASS